MSVSQVWSLRNAEVPHNLHLIGWLPVVQLTGYCGHDGNQICLSCTQLGVLNTATPIAVIYIANIALILVTIPSMSLYILSWTLL